MLDREPSGARPPVHGARAACVARAPPRSSLPIRVASSAVPSRRRERPTAHMSNLGGAPGAVPHRGVAAQVSQRNRALNYRSRVATRGRRSEVRVTSISRGAMEAFGGAESGWQRSPAHSTRRLGRAGADADYNHVVSVSSTLPRRRVGRLRHADVVGREDPVVALMCSAGRAGRAQLARHLERMSACRRQS
jgi:hypothetical protein